MVKWPDHNESVREDELYVFAYCSTRWPADPFESRLTKEYEELVQALNARFGSHLGVYTADGVREYLKHLRTNPKYRWPSTSRKRYHQFEDKIEEYITQHPAVFGSHPRSLQRTPIGAKRK